MARRWILVAAVSLARVAFGYQFQTLASLGPELLERFGLGYASLGGLIGLYMAPGILVALPGGLLGRRYGEGAVVGGGLALMGLGSLVSGLAGGSGQIGAGRLLAGCGAVLLVVMQGKMISDRFPGRAFMPVMGLVLGAFPVGVGLVELTHGPLVRAFGWSGLFLGGAAVAVLALLLFLLGCERTLPPAGPAWALPSRRECGLLVVAGVIWTAYNAGYYGFLSYMPSYLAVRGHSPGLLALVLTVATWSNLPAMVLGGALAARFGNGPVFYAGTLAEIVAVAGPAVLDWPLLWGLLFGTAASLHAGVIIGIGTLSARPENRAVGMGLFYMIYYAGGALLPAMCGRAADLAGDPAGALVAAAVLAGVAVPAYRLHGFLSRRPA
jgi:MFS family permease